MLPAVQRRGAGITSAKNWAGTTRLLADLLIRRIDPLDGELHIFILFFTLLMVPNPSHRAIYFHHFCDSANIPYLLYAYFLTGGVGDVNVVGSAGPSDWSDTAQLMVV